MLAQLTIHELLLIQICTVLYFDGKVRLCIIANLAFNAYGSFCITNSFGSEKNCSVIITPSRYIGDGVLFLIDLFVCLFVSLLARLRENGWTDLHETFREGVE